MTYLQLQWMLRNTNISYEYNLIISLLRNLRKSIRNKTLYAQIEKYPYVVECILHLKQTVC